MHRKRKNRQWPNVYARTHRSGEVGFVVDLGLINGKRERQCFPSKVEAETFAEVKRIERQNEGTAALALSSDTRQDAAKAAAILTPHGVSLWQAAQYYAEHVIAYQDAPLVTEIAIGLFAGLRSAELLRLDWPAVNLTENAIVVGAQVAKNSFASYHLAAFGDAMKTATMLGHKDTGVVHNHYKALVQKTEAEKFWKLRPAPAKTEPPSPMVEPCKS